MKEKTKTTVNIFGAEYTIKGDASSEYIQKLAAYVDEQMSAIVKQTSALSFPKVAILAAINITDELFKIRDSAKEKEIDVRIRKLVDKIEKEI